MIQVTVRRTGQPSTILHVADARLQEVLDRAARTFGDGSTLAIPDKLPEPTEGGLRHWEGIWK